VLDISSRNGKSNADGHIGQENIHPEDSALGNKAFDSKDASDFIVASFS
jgi:hypothetical protein